MIPPRYPFHVRLAIILTLSAIAWIAIVEIVRVLV